MDTRGSEVPGQIIPALQQGLGDDLIAVVLFGSRARGEADAGSDWALLLIARQLPGRALRRHMWLKRMLPDEWRGQVALLAKTPEEFDARLTSVYLDIALDGIVLYDSEGYAAERLAGLKALIEARGLRRERVEHDLVWYWQQFPGFGWSLDWEGVR